VKNSATHESTPKVSRFSDRQRAYIYAGTVLAGGVLVIALMGAFKPTPEAVEPEPEKPPKVDTVTVVPATLNVSVISQGAVSPRHSINLVSEVAGRVVKVTHDYADGGFFSKDQAILMIDDRDYIFALRQAQSELAKAQELLAIEKGRARQASQEWRDLGNDEANELFLRKPQLASAMSAVEAAQANRDKAKLNLSRTALSAPFDGRINRKHVDVGQFVSPGTVIAEVYSTEAVQVRLPLTDRQVAKVNLPLTARNHNDEHAFPPVVLNAVYGGKDYQWNGHIVRTEGALDAKSRVVYAVVEVKNPYEIIPGSDRPPLAVGMYVKAEIIGRQMQDVVRLPRKILQKKDQVIVVDDTNKLRVKNITLLESDGEQVLVQGLATGDRVLMTRLPSAIPGLEVEPDAKTAVADAPDEARSAPSENADTPATEQQEG